MTRPGRSSRWPALLLPGVLLALAACAAPEVAEGRAYLVAADASGAIAWDPGAREYVGFRADGAVAWRNNERIDEPIDITCAGACPTALVADQAAGSGRLISDRQAGAWQPGVPLWSAGEGGDSVSYQGAVLSVSGTEVPARAGRPQLVVDETGNHALVVVKGQSAQVIRLARTGDRWNVVATQDAAPVENACVSADEFALLHPDDITWSGRRIDYPHAGWCALVRGLLVTARFASKSGQNVTEVVAWGPDGQQRWQRTVPALARVWVRGDTAVVAQPGKPQVLRLTDGAEVQVPGLDGADDVVAVSAEELVTLRGLTVRRVRVA